MSNILELFDIGRNVTLEVTGGDKIQMESDKFFPAVDEGKEKNLLHPFRA
jgi:hypothetical protein